MTTTVKQIMNNASNEIYRVANEFKVALPHLERSQGESLRAPSVGAVHVRADHHISEGEQVPYGVRLEAEQ